MNHELNLFPDTQKSVTEVIENMMEKVLDNVLINDPFKADEHRAKKPLYASLVPDEIFKGSHFERRFVTPFGKVWEKLAESVAINYHKDCHVGKKIVGEVGQERLRRIQEVLNDLEHKRKGLPKKSPDWSNELKYILEGGGTKIPTEVVCDIFIDSKKTSQKYAFELKAPLPNSDQTKVSKEKMFKLLSMEPIKVNYAFYALPYNPYGKKEDYNWAFPMRWFDMHSDESVLIGEEFWDLVGGVGTYSKFIREVNLLGKHYRERIYREFLGIEPPESSSNSTLG
jgi:hypothetical protein